MADLKLPLGSLRTQTAIFGSALGRVRIILTCALVAGCAGESGAAHASLDPHIVHACTVTMEASEGTTDFDNCVSSIVGALDQVRRDKALSQAWTGCSSKGPEGSPDFARCVLNREENFSMTGLGETR